MGSLRQQALRIVQEALPANKLALARAAAVSTAVVGADLLLEEPPGLPGRPSAPALLPHRELPQFSLATPQGRAALVHSIAHIELNAVEIV